MGSISAGIATRQDKLASALEETGTSPRAIHEFLVWLERSKGLRLCEPFKPQYDWYTPVPTNPERLAREFFGDTREGRK